MTETKYFQGCYYYYFKHNVSIFSTLSYIMLLFGLYNFVYIIYRLWEPENESSNNIQIDSSEPELIELPSLN